MVTREQLSENRVFGRTRPEHKESAKIALSEGLITDFSDSQGGGKPCVCPPFRFLCHRGFSTLHDIDAFRCIVAEISDNLAGNKRTIVLIISALK